MAARLRGSSTDRPLVSGKRLDAFAIVGWRCTKQRAGDRFLGAAPFVEDGEVVLREGIVRIGVLGAK